MTIHNMTRHFSTAILNNSRNLVPKAGASRVSTIVGTCTQPPAQQQQMEMHHSSTDISTTITTHTTIQIPSKSLQSKYLHTNTTKSAIRTIYTQTYTNTNIFQKQQQQHHNFSTKPKRRTLPQLQKDAITLTPSAAKRITHLLATAQPQSPPTPNTTNDNDSNATHNSDPHTPIGIRLGVKRRGCNGLSYTLNYVYPHDSLHQQTLPTHQQDEVVESEGVKVYIEPMAVFSVVGTVMDWVESDLSSEFTFENPNSKGECGCGESFTV